MNARRSPSPVVENDSRHPRAQDGENKTARAETRVTEHASYTPALRARIVQLAFGSAIVVLGLVGSLAYRSVLASNDSSAWVRHTLEVLENLEDTQLAMETVVESARGFVFTGDETYLERYQATASSLAQHEAAVRSLTVDNPEQQRTLSALETLTAERMQRAGLNISLRRTQGFAAAAGAVRGQPAEKSATDFLAIISKMQNEERRLLAIRDADATRHSNQTNAILFSGIVLGLLITGTAFWCVRRDNSRRWLAESALRDSEEQYRLLIGGVKDYAIFMLDPNGKVASWNGGAERIKGYKADEIIGKNFSVFYPPEDLAKEKPAGILIQATAEGKFEEDGWRLRKDGSRFWAHVLITPVRSENGELRGFSKVTQDITERKNAEALILEQIQQLSQSAVELQQFRVLVRGVKDYAIFMLDPTGNITTWNEGAERIKGYKANEIIGQHFSRFYTPEDLAAGKPSRALRVAVAEGKYEEEGWRVRKDGSHFWANVIIIPLRGENGELRGFSKITRDITARKTAEALLSEKMKELKRSNEELGQFATVAAHDLQEPLRMVSDYLALLSRRYRGKLGADADEFIAFALDAAGRMQRLINGLLYYSRVGTAGLKLHNISSEKSLQRAIINLRGVIETSGALVSHDPLPSVMGDEIQLEQLFQNLVGNAIKYQKSGIPKIHVSAVMNGEHKWDFSVQDNGIGIDSKNLERIFGMFQRLHGQAEFEGTGIGLAICKKIVERHGGDISVESQPGRGSTFHFALAEGTTSS